MTENGWESGAPVGRPAEVTLGDPEHQRELARIFQRTNRTRKDGSARMAWDLFLERHPEIGWERNESKHSIPEAARVVCRRARALVGYHRQGEKWMATGGPSSHGDALAQVHTGAEPLVGDAHRGVGDRAHVDAHVERALRLVSGRPLEAGVLALAGGEHFVGKGGAAAVDELAAELLPPGVLVGALLAQLAGVEREPAGDGVGDCCAVAAPAFL